MTADLPGTPDAEGWRRLHPLSPLLRGGLVLLIILGILLANFRDRLVELLFSGSMSSDQGVEIDVGSEGDLLTLYGYLADQGFALAVLGGLLGVVLLIVLFAWVSWRFATYRITDSAVEARHGVLFRTHRRAPLERIQSVNVQRSLLARVLGLAKIEVVTAGQGGKVELAYLGYRDAKLVRERILRAAREKAESDVPPVDVSSPPPVVDFAGRVHAAADPLSARTYDFIDSDIEVEALPTLVRVPIGRLVASIFLSWESIFMLAVIVGVAIAGSVGEPAVLVALIPIVLAWAGVVFGQFNKGFNFSLSRGRDAVRTGSGLTATVTETIPFGRIHAVEARQPLLWRPLKWWRVRITTAGHSAAQAGQNTVQNVVLPVGREDDVLRVLETLLPGIGDEQSDIETLRDGLTGPGAGYLPAAGRASWLLLFGRSRAGALIADGDSAEATLRVRRGAVTRSLSIMPIARAQSVQVAQPFGHRLLGLATVQAHTVLGPVRMQMRGIELASARRLFDDLAATVLRVQEADARARLAHRAPQREGE